MQQVLVQDEDYIHLTPEKKMKIFSKCANDFFFFCKNYCIIISKTQKVKFKLYEYQKDVALAIINNEDVIINKARQLGLSTLVATIVAWKILFNTNEEVVLISENAKKAKDLLKKVKLIIRELPTFLRMKLVTDNVQDIELSNGSRCQSESRSENAGRSATVTFLVLDEAAFIEKNIIENIWDAASPTLTTTDGHAVIISTPNGMGGWFFNMWEGANSGLNNFTPFEIPWQMHPDRDENWARGELKKMNSNKKKFMQEYEVSFISSGDTLFDMEWLLEYYNRVKEDPKEMKQSVVFYNEETEKEEIIRVGTDPDLWIYEYPDPEKEYLLCADPARGDAADFHAFHVFELYTLNLVVEYRGRIPSVNFAKLINSVAIEYNTAATTVENNGVGWAVIQKLVEIGQKNFVYTHKGQVLIDPHKTRQTIEGGKMVPGFSMTGNSRVLCIEALISFINEESFAIKSRRLLSELKTFSFKSGRYEAMDDACHDDLVLSLAQGLYVYKIYVLAKERAKLRMNAIINSMSSEKRLPTQSTFKQTFSTSDHMEVPRIPKIVSSKTKKRYNAQYVKQLKKDFDFDESQFLK